MTPIGFYNTKDAITSEDMESVLLGFRNIVEDENYYEAKKQLSFLEYDNSQCPTIGNTIEKLCKFVEHVLRDSTNIRGTWPILRESLYMPAGIQLLEAMKDYLIEK